MTGTPLAIRRILIAMDRSRHGSAALETAAELAAALRAELAGLFVEDAELVAAAKLSIVRQVDESSVSDVGTDQIEQQLRLQAGQAQRDLAKAARSVRIEWSFESRRGKVAEQVNEAAKAADLVVIGKGGWASPGRLGSTALQVSASCAAPSLLLAHSMVRGCRVAVLSDESPSGIRARQIAEILAAATVHHPRFIDADSRDPAEEALDVGAGLLVLPRQSADPVDLEALLVRSHLPVLIV